MLDFLGYLELERGLSRNTLEAYRSDLAAVRRVPARPRARPARGHARRARRVRLRAGRRATSGAAGRAGDAPAQDRLPALVLPPPAPRADDRPRPGRRAARARARRARLPEVLSRDEVGRLLAQPRGHDAGGAARPRAARDDVRVRAARVGGDRARALRARPRGRDPARPGQGLEGAARPDRQQGDRELRAYLERGRPRLVGLRRRAARVRQPARRAALAPGALQDRPAPRRERRAGAPDEPAHAPPHVRHPPAGRRLRPALAAGDARPRRHRHDPDLHAPVGRPAARRVLRRPSAGADRPRRRRVRRRGNRALRRGAGARVRARATCAAAGRSSARRPARSASA